MAKIIAVANQKGGCGKTTLSLSLGASLARKGYRICLVDSDAQANLTMGLGYMRPDEIQVTIAHIMNEIINSGINPEKSELFKDRKYILNAQGMDFVPSSIELADLENIIINTISRETVLKKFIDYIKPDYDFIIIDCMPSLNVITVNALNAADEVLIPVQAQFFSAKGLELLLKTITKVKDSLNPNLNIGGVIINMFDSRYNFHNEVVDAVKGAYDKYIKIFNTKIPVSVKVTEAQAHGKSIFEYDAEGKVAESYETLVKEVLGNEQ
jgi:chromosome partitioning protein